MKRQIPVDTSQTLKYEEISIKFLEYVLQSRIYYKLWEHELFERIIENYDIP